MNILLFKSFIALKSFFAFHKRKIYTQRGKANRIFVAAMRKTK